MKIIFKYPLPIGVMDAVVMMPAGAQILTAQEQHGVICLWALVDDDNSKEARRILIFGTGEPLPANPLSYIGTIHQHGGALIWHVFEVIKS